MYRLIDVLQNTAGDALEGYRVRLLDSSGNVVAIYSDSSSTPIISTSGIANTMLTNEHGEYACYVADGDYATEIADAAGVQLHTVAIRPMYSGSAYAIATATAAATAAEADRIAAEAARSDAEAAALALQVDSGIYYPTPEDGVDPTTGVADGRYYNVFEDGRSKLYLNDGGTPVLVYDGAFVTNAAALTSGYLVKGAGDDAVAISGLYETGGNLGIGTTTPGNYKLKAVHGTSGEPVIAIQSTSTTGYSGLHFLKSDGTLMGHVGYGNTGVASPLTNAVYVGSISNLSLAFTTNDQLRAYIDSVGTTHWNGVNIDGSGAFRLQATAGGYCFSTKGSANYTAHQFVYNTSEVGTITCTSTATAYNTSSDARLKENVADAGDAGALIEAVQVRQFDWKASGEHQRYGVIAQELAAVFPEAVTTGPNGMMMVDYSKLVMPLLKEVQSLRTRLNALVETI